MKIKRDQYLDELVSRKHNGLIKVVTGLRRCGKTYLLFTLFKEHLLAEGVDEKHIVEIAFDAFENRQLRDPQVLFPPPERAASRRRHALCPARRSAAAGRL